MVVCIVHLGCLRDIELAEQAKYPIIDKLLQRKAKCQRLMQGATKEEEDDLQLSFEPSVNFPYVANVLEVQRNEEFGGHVVANCDIDVGKTVVIEKAYCSLGQAPDRFQCYTCTKEEANFVACPRCTDVMFCNEECRNENIIHKKFCGAVEYKFHTRISSTWNNGIFKCRRNDSFCGSDTSESYYTSPKCHQLRKCSVRNTLSDF